MLRDGIPYKTIANRLGITTDTARRHGSRVLQKTGLKSAAAVPYAHLQASVHPGDFVHAKLPVLTPTEARVVCHLLSGLSSKEIARLMCVSPRTIEKHKENIFIKLDVTSTRQLCSRISSFYVIHGISQPNQGC